MLKGRIVSCCLAMILVATSMTFQSCTTSAANDVQTVIDSLTSAVPLLQQFKPDLVADAQAALNLAQQAKDAIVAAGGSAKSVTAKLVGVVDSLIPTFQKIVSGVLSAQLGPATTTVILAALAGADIALHALLNILNTSPPSQLRTAVASNASVIAFQKEEVWGLRYKKK